MQNNFMNTPSNIVGIAEIAHLSGVSKQAVSNWRKRHSDFPKPFQVLDSGPLFQKSEIMTWFFSRKYELAAEKNLNTAKLEKEVSKFFQDYQVKTGEFDRYHCVEATSVSEHDRLKLTVKDEFGAHQIYEATVINEWGGNFIVGIDKTYSPELAWENSSFPKVGETYIIEPAMISVGLKRDGSQYGGLTVTPDEKYILSINLFSPRFGHNDKYKIMIEENKVSFFRTKIKTAICKWSYEQGWVWERNPIQDILSNNSVYPPRTFQKRLTYIFEAIRLGELETSEAQKIIDEIADWVNLTTHNKPKHQFWDGVF